MKKTFIIFLIYFLYSCDCKKINFTADERKWLGVYSNSKIIIFKSNQNEYDTLFIDKTISYFNEECNRMAFGYEKNEYLNIYLKPRDSLLQDFNDCSMTLFKKDNRKSKLDFRFFGLQYSKILKNENLIFKKVNLKYLNKKIDSVCYFQDKVNLENFGKFNYKSFYWSKKEGLLKYEMNDGEVFELYKVE